MELILFGVRVEYFFREYNSVTQTISFLFAEIDFT